MEPITFLAALAGTNTAAKWFSEDSDGSAKVVLEVPATDTDEAHKLKRFAGKVFRVTVVDE